MPQSICPDPDPATNDPGEEVEEGKRAMGFWITTLIFLLAGVVASLLSLLCCNRGPSTNLFHLTLVITATVCCWMMWAIVYLAQLKPLINPILSGE